MWTVIYIAPNQDTADEYKELLEDEGIFVQLKPVSGSHKSNSNMVEILVSQYEAEEAHEILTSIINNI